MPDDPDAAALGARACFGVLALGFRIGLPEGEARQLFDEGLGWAARTNDPRYAGHMYQALSVYEGGSNLLDAAITHASEWERVARDLPDEDRRASALWPSLMPLVNRGDLAAVRARALEQLTLTSDHSDWGLRDWGISAHGNALAILGRIELYGGVLARAREHLARGVEITRGVGDPEGEVFCWGTLSELGFLIAEPDLCREAAQRSVALSERLGAMSRVIARECLGTQLLLDDRPEEAMEALS